jgi:DNA polymerase III alpha subunit
MKKIMSIKTQKQHDNDADLSYLGKFHRGNRKSFDMETYDGFWFTPANHWPHNPKNWNHVSQEDKEKVIKQYGSLKKADWTYARKDRQRLIDYYRDKWSMIGIILKIQVGISEDGKNWGILDIDNSSWGIESDSGEKYFNEVIEDLKHEAIYKLKEIGFTEEEITVALAAASATGLED